MTKSTLIDAFDVLLLDLDGVVYRGGHAIPNAVDAIQRSRSIGKVVGYVTNNSSRLPETIVAQLQEYGLEAQPTEIVGSASVAVDILTRRIAAPAKVLVVGGEGLRHAVLQAGYEIVASAADKPVAVLQGFSPEVGWRDLAEASFAIQAGAIWIATNQDWTLPLEHGLAPGNGTLVSAVHTAVGQLPEFAGKPAVPIFEAAVKRFDAKRPLFVGDRLDTDSKGARAAGIKSAIVMTGVCTRKELLAARPEERPDWILEDLADLHSNAAELVKTKRGYRSEGSLVELNGNRIQVVEGDPSSVAALRAACQVIWESGKSVHMLDVDMRLV